MFVLTPRLDTVGLQIKNSQAHEEQVPPIKAPISPYNFGTLRQCRDKKASAGLPIVVLIEQRGLPSSGLAGVGLKGGSGLFISGHGDLLKKERIEKK